MSELAEAKSFGKLGYVFQGLGDGHTEDGRAATRCNGCREWYSSAHVICPGCGTAPPARRGHPGSRNPIDRARKDRHLFEYAAAANRQRKYAPGITSDVNLPPA